MKLEEPPTAALTMMAFSKASLVNILSMVKFSFTISTILLPLNCANTFFLESAAGIATAPDKVSPNDSTMQAMVLAVPIVMQWPMLRLIQLSANSHSSCVIFPVFMSSSNFHTCVPDPIVCPLYRPLSIGPPGITIVGNPTLDAPITVEGVVLSQPVNNTTPSIGLPRMDSSASILAKLRNNIAVGFNNVSPKLIIGNSTGNPPASSTPLFTDSAISRKCALHGVSSLNVLQMPITGRPSNISVGMPWFFIQLR